LFFNSKKNWFFCSKNHPKKHLFDDRDFKEEKIQRKIYPLLQNNRITIKDVFSDQRPYKMVQKIRQA